MDEDIYCEVCQHFGCPTKLSLDPDAQHKPIDEPCGRYDCCIN